MACVRLSLTFVVAVVVAVDVASTAVKRPKRFSFYIFNGILCNVKLKHGQGCIK